MDAQQLHDHIIKPTLEYMGGNYDSKNARMLLLATAAIESKCNYYIKQIDGPALGIWQMEPDTHEDIWENCDAFNSDDFINLVASLETDVKLSFRSGQLIYSPMYACAMARLKYSMDTEKLPYYRDKIAIYNYYKRIYNTELGASTWEKFENAWNECGLDSVEL